MLSFILNQHHLVVLSKKDREGARKANKVWDVWKGTEIQRRRVLEVRMEKADWEAS